MNTNFVHNARSAIKRFHTDESGATAIEYGLIAAAVGLVLVATMPAFQSATNATYGIDKLAVLKPKMVDIPELGPGEIGILTASIKQVRDTKVGDTITHEKKGTDQPLPIGARSPTSWEAATKPSSALPVATIVKVCPMFSPITSRSSSGASRPSAASVSRAARP